MMITEKPLASLSLDLDNKWSYMKTHGDAGWEALPSYFPTLIPRVLPLLDESKVTITFFVVGQDAERDENQAIIGSIASAGHEIGNHSFSHEPWLHLYSRSQIEEEFARTEDAIMRVTRTRPVGFRGPGFSSSDAVVSVLAERGYWYDASVLPTWIGPLARSYYFMASTFAGQEKEKRDLLFGTWNQVLQPLKAHVVTGHSRLLAEVPVTTMPVFRAPFHVSYIIYLSSFSRALALAYFKTALSLCRITNVQPSLLLHPLDFLGADDVSGLEFFPGMRLKSTNKVALVRTLLKMYCDTFRVVNLREHARTVLEYQTELQPSGAVRRPVS